ncbi:glycoside hydrolase family 43 protein [Sporolactobacillus shoreicorticis]|uniref:Glycoside hydrolase family 43 protein n=1 Tax=Sporolactobacillus shoreicorticis TaxID=1923877 RepID=A0ABW5S2C0_9BACL|nr:glycoside hydrolase family 43 protein [Sporolactobacillus shoreicorticis]MCO7124656.1 glycoside hydrolase family 43 protein [Sporolactobacillus shoreicorticis]
MKIQNPIISGFHPDPCICRVEDTYYLATSTFEWYPGVEILSSHDLAHWTIVSRPLIDKKHLNLRGIPDSAGIWAPALSYSDGKFWLVYTIAYQIDGNYKDVKNYLTTSSTINGEWSDPIFLNASGFDPSLFHDDDGKKYIINPRWDYRPLPSKTKFSGLVLQEYDLMDRKLISEPVLIHKGSAVGGTEGPHLMKKDGWYYILAAEGGTGRHHSISVSRSKNLFGPYELSPFSPLITAYHYPDNPLQKSGHGNLVQSPTGDWYLVHLCSRYYGSGQFSPLGRETALQEIVWEYGWPRLRHGSNEPQVTVQVPESSETETNGGGTTNNTYETFEKPTLGAEWITLRTPFEEKISLIENPGKLRIHGGDSLTSVFNQSLVARRWQSVNFLAETSLDFNPETYQQLAGLVCYYNTKCWIFLGVSRDEHSGRRVVSITTNDNGTITEPLRGLYGYLNDSEPVFLQMNVQNAKIRCLYGTDGRSFTPLGEWFDGQKLSDQHVSGWAYTGAVVGLTAIDFDTKNSYADFDYFQYKETQK